MTLHLTSNQRRLSGPSPPFRVLLCHAGPGTPQATFLLCWRFPAGLHTSGRLHSWRRQRALLPSVCFSSQCHHSNTSPLQQQLFFLWQLPNPICGFSSVCRALETPASQWGLVSFLRYLGPSPTGSFLQDQRLQLWSFSTSSLEIGVSAPWSSPLSF